jgi:hypothetical protein
VEYDLDNEDEDWLRQYNLGRNKLNDLLFEKMLWKLELACAEATDSALTAAGAVGCGHRQLGMQHLACGGLLVKSAAALRSLCLRVTLALNNTCCSTPDSNTDRTCICRRTYHGYSQQPVREHH